MAEALDSRNSLLLTLANRVSEVLKDAPTIMDAEEVLIGCLAARVGISHGEKAGLMLGLNIFEYLGYPVFTEPDQANAN